MPGIPKRNTRHSRFMNFHLTCKFFMIFLSKSSKERVKTAKGGRKK